MSARFAIVLIVFGCLAAPLAAFVVTGDSDVAGVTCLVSMFALIIGPLFVTEATS